MKRVEKLANHERKSDHAEVRCTFPIASQFCLHQILHQIKAVFPISLFLVVFQTVFLQQPLESWRSVLASLLAVVVGLAMFTFGLLHGLIPLGERLGRVLPTRLSTPTILAIAFLIGCVVTLAEPALGVVQTLETLVPSDKGVYLHSLLGQHAHILTLTVAFGVGVSTALGLFRIHKGWSLTPVLLCVLTLTLTLTAYVALFTDKAETIGLAWDLGAVTTGPVTVPMVIALGMGIGSSSRTKQPAHENEVPEPQKDVEQPLVSPTHVRPSSQNAFGVVTLASLVPIDCVLLLIILLPPPTQPTANKSHINTTLTMDNYTKTASTGRRLQQHTTNNYQPTPQLQSYVTGAVNKSSVNLEHKNSLSPPVDTAATNTSILTSITTGSGNHVEPLLELEPADLWLLGVVTEVESTIRSFLPLVMVLYGVLYGVLRDRRSVTSQVVLDTVTQKYTTVQAHFPLLLSFFGLLLFNIGLKDGLNRLGADVGMSAPAAFMHVSQVANSPLFGYIPGVSVVIVFGWLLGFGATMAEPSTQTLAITVHNLTNGEFKTSAVMLSVAVGVGTGLALAVCKLLFAWNLTILLFIGYTAAIAITMFSKQLVIDVAWDSAGVTTDAVTVPIVLAMGLGLGGALGLGDGFGLLALASVCPIISVLVCGAVFVG